VAVPHYSTWHQSVRNVMEDFQIDHRGAMGRASTKPEWLFGYRISNIVEHLLDLRQGDLLWVVGEADRPGRDINRDLTHSCQFAHRSFNGVFAMLTRNVGSYQGCRFLSKFHPVVLCVITDDSTCNPSFQRS
jgi:hypothetical protein